MATRRQFLETMGRLGGVSAVYLSMQALGLIAMPRAFAATPDLGAGTGQGKSVVILGAGIAGLVAAYELRKAGYAVTVIEANDRIGGRVWTIRGGDRIIQDGRPEQRSDYDAGLYFNAGAARIPAHHHAILGYARDLKVPLEVMVNVNRSAGMDFGAVVRERQAVNDVRGRFAELLAKAIDKGALNQELSGVDKQALRGYLEWWGDLKRGGAFKGSERSGYVVPPGGYGDAGKLVDPLTLRQLADRGFFQSGLVFEEIFDQQAPMFQPVGGMDRIALALFDQVKDVVRLGTPVTGVRPTANGVRVTLAKGGVVDADYCLCTLPAPLVAKLDAPFTAAKRAALKATNYSTAAKVAWQAPRFWEREGVYGGLAWTSKQSEVVWYPSGDWHGDKGVLVGAYAVGWLDAGEKSVRDYCAMSFAQRFAVSRGVIERLHPGQSQLLGKPLTVAWDQTPFASGVGADWKPGQRQSDYVELARPEGRIYFAGEHLSYLPYWQEGAAVSAHKAIILLHQRAVSEAPARRVG